MACTVVVATVVGMQAAAANGEPEDLKGVMFKTSRSASTLLFHKLAALPFACIMQHEYLYRYAAPRMHEISVGQVSAILY